MKVIIAGPRTVFDMKAVEKAAAHWEHCFGRITEVVSGCAKGVDKTGEEWAFMRNIPVKKFRAEWETLGFVAGPVRNKKMAEHADGLAAIWDGKSGGTADMIRCAHKRKLLLVIYRIDKDEFTDEIPPPKQRKKKKEKPEEVQEELF